MTKRRRALYIALRLYKSAHHYDITRAADRAVILSSFWFSNDSAPRCFRNSDEMRALANRIAKSAKEISV